MSRSLLSGERFETRDLVSYNQWAFSSKSLGRHQAVGAEAFKRPEGWRLFTVTAGLVAV